MSLKLFRYKNAYNCILSFFSVAFMLTLLFIIEGYAPFGSNSLSWADGNIQYLDFFSYLKDVLQGKNSLLYTFSKTLGGTNIAVFSYYLSSPFNILVLFFSKSQMHTFFNLTILLKLSLSAGTCAYFFNKRFNKSLEYIKHSDIYIILLSICYALSHYNITQCSNIMWLDGVYLLPIILLGIYKLIQGEHIWKLSIPVALSILFNWYSGGINCIFSGFWLLLELCLQYSKKSLYKKNFCSIFFIILKYIFSVFLGVLISCILFVPTIAALQNSSRGSLQLDMLFDFSFMGDIPSIIHLYSYGAKSSYGSVSLFCGMLPLICVIGFFSSHATNIIEKKQKIVLSISVFISILFYFWHPFFILFSLFKDATSYYYRYSYVTIFTFIFIAGFFLLKSCNNKIPYIKIGLLVTSLILVLYYIKPDLDRNLVYFSAIAFMIFSISFYYLQKYKNKISFIIIIVIITFTDLGYATKQNILNYHTENIDFYKEYVIQQNKQINSLKEYDNSLYRISQTSTHNMSNINLTANYNEALAYNYWSLSGYTSSPDDIQRDFLDKIGYRINGENMCIVNTSILGIDSLLGVKYILSSNLINGLCEITKLGEYNDKKVYLNPYALPFAITYSPTNNLTTQTSNPFKYQNILYSELLGKKITLYEPLNYKIIQKGDIQSNTSQKYLLDIPQGNYAIYGNIPWNTDLFATLSVDDKFQTAYSRWLSPSVFYIPTQNGSNNATIEFSSTISYDIKQNKEQFYGLNLNKLQQATDLLKTQTVDKCEITNGHVYIETTATKNEYLFLSIPYDKGWSITLNGKSIDTKLLGNCFYSIPLSKGNNVIEMQYSVNGLKEGIIFSFLGIILLVIFSIIEISIKSKRSIVHAK